MTEPAVDGRGSVPDPKQITSKGVWLVFPICDAEESCIARYKRRFGGEPIHVVADKLWRWLGPVED